MENKEKTLLEIIDIKGEPNILDEMVSNDFRDFKIHNLSKRFDPDAEVLNEFKNALIGVSHDGRAVYDVDKIRITILEDMGYDSIRADELIEEFATKSTSKLRPILISIDFNLLKLSL